MKKTFLFFCLFIFSAPVFSQSPQNDFDYAIVFGGCFNKDIISLKINNNSILKNYIVNNTDSVLKGNLSLKQSDNKININYNRNPRTISKIIFSNVLQVEITVNKEVSKFNIDLRKGKILLIEFCQDKNATFKSKKLTIDQIQEPFLFI
ncbi:MAG: hypothetical protein ABUT20_61610 [Bacteroidota bacterium]